MYTAKQGGVLNIESCPVYVVYTVQLVLKWLEETVGGLDKMEQINREKAGLLYRMIDESGFYRGTADKGSRSMMNVTFRLPSEDQEKQFVRQALEHGLSGLKGHRSVGGLRASIYNAMPDSGVHRLVEFMADFKAKHG